MSDIFNNDETAEVSAPELVIDPVVEPEIKEAPVEVVEAVVEAPVVVETPVAEEVAPVVEVQGLGPIANGVMGVGTMVKTPKKSTSKKSEPKKDTVAVHSTRNVTWAGVGKVYIGYNIVEKSAADQWLTRGHCRLATPEEVAKEFGK